MKSILGAFGRGKKKPEGVTLSGETARRLEQLLNLLQPLLERSSSRVQRVDNRSAADMQASVQGSSAEFARGLSKHGSDANVLLSAVLHTLQLSPGLFSEQLSESTLRAADFEKWRIEISRAVDYEVDRMPDDSVRLLARVLAAADLISERAPEALQDLFGYLFPSRAADGSTAKDVRVKLVAGLVGRHATINRYMTAMHRDEGTGQPQDKAAYWSRHFEDAEKGILTGATATPRLPLETVASSEDPFDSSEALSPPSADPRVDRAELSGGELFVDTSDPPSRRPESPLPVSNRRRLSSEPAPESSVRRSLNHTGSYISPPGSPTVSEMSDRLSPRYSQSQNRRSNPSSGATSPETKISRERGYFYDKPDSGDALDEIPTLEDSYESVTALTPTMVAGAGDGLHSIDYNSPLTKGGSRRRSQLLPVVHGKLAPLNSPSDTLSPGVDLLDRDEITADDLRRAFDSCPTVDGGNVETSTLEKKLRWSQGVPALADAIKRLRQSGNIDTDISWEELMRISRTYIKVPSTGNSPEKRQSRDLSRRSARVALESDKDNAMEESMESLQMEKLDPPDQILLSSNLRRVAHTSPVVGLARKIPPVVSTDKSPLSPGIGGGQGMRGLDMIAQQMSPVSTETALTIDRSDDELVNPQLSEPRPRSSRREHRDEFKESKDQIKTANISGRAPSPTSDVEISMASYMEGVVSAPPGSPDSLARGKRVSRFAYEGNNAESKRSHWALTGDDLDSSLESEKSFPSSQVLAHSRTAELRRSMELDASWDDEETPYLKATDLDFVPNASSDKQTLSESDIFAAISYVPTAQVRVQAKKNMFSLTALDASTSDVDSVSNTPDRAAAVEEVVKVRSVSVDNLQITPGSNDSNLSPLVRNNNKRGMVREDASNFEIGSAPNLITSDPFPTFDTQPLPSSRITAPSPMLKRAEPIRSPTTENKVQTTLDNSIDIVEPTSAPAYNLAPAAGGKTSAMKGFASMFKFKSSSLKNLKKDEEEVVSNNKKASDTFDPFDTEAGPKRSGGFFSRLTSSSAPKEIDEENNEDDKTLSNSFDEDTFTAQHPKDGMGRKPLSNMTAKKDHFDTEFDSEITKGGKSGLNFVSQPKDEDPFALEPKAPTAEGFLSLSSKFRTASDVNAHGYVSAQATEGPALRKPKDPFAEPETDFGDEGKSGRHPSQQLSMSARYQTVSDDDSRKTYSEDIPGGPSLRKPRDPFAEPETDFGEEGKSGRHPSQQLSMSARYRTVSDDDSRKTHYEDIPGGPSLRKPKDPFAEPESINRSLDGNYNGSSKALAEELQSRNLKDPFGEAISDDHGRGQNHDLKQPIKQSVEFGQEKFSWLRSVGTKASSFLGRRSKSFNSADTFDSNPPLTSTGLIDDTGFLSDRPLSIDSHEDLANLETEDKFSAAGQSTAANETITEDETLRTITEDYIMNEIRKDVNKAKENIHTEAKFADNGDVVFEAKIVGPTRAMELQSDNPNSNVEGIGGEDKQSRQSKQINSSMNSAEAQLSVTAIPTRLATTELAHDSVFDFDGPDVAIPNPPSHPPPHNTRDAAAVNNERVGMQHPYTIDTSAVMASNYPDLSDWNTDIDAENEADAAQMNKFCQSTADSVFKTTPSNPAHQSVETAAVKNQTMLAKVEAPPHTKKMPKVYEVVAPKKPSVEEMPVVKEGDRAKVEKTAEGRLIQPVDTSAYVRPNQFHVTNRATRPIHKNYPQITESKLAAGASTGAVIDYSWNEEKAVNMHALKLQVEKSEQDSRPNPPTMVERKEEHERVAGFSSPQFVQKHYPETSSAFKQHMPGPRRASSPKSPDRFGTPTFPTRHAVSTKQRPINLTTDYGAASPVRSRPGMIRSPDAFRITTRSNLGFADTLEIPRMTAVNEDTADFSFMGASARRHSTPIKSLSCADAIDSLVNLESPWLQTMRGREREHLSPEKNTNPISSFSPRESQHGPGRGPDLSRHKFVPNSGEWTMSSRPRAAPAWLTGDLTLGEILNAYVEEARAASPPRVQRSVRTYPSEVKDKWRSATVYAVSGGPKPSQSVDLSALPEQRGKDHFYNIVQDVSRGRASADSAAHIFLATQKRVEEKTSEALRLSKATATGLPRYRDANVSIGPQTSMEKVLVKSMAAQTVTKKWVGMSNASNRVSGSAPIGKSHQSGINLTESFTGTSERGGVFGSSTLSSPETKLKREGKSLSKRDSNGSVAIWAVDLYRKEKDAQS